MNRYLLFFIIFIFTFSILDHSLTAYQKLGKNSRAYYYTKKKRQWDDNAYKSYFYYDHDVYPQYTYVYPGHYYYYGYPYYYHNDRGVLYSYWGY